MRLNTTKCKILSIPSKDKTPPPTIFLKGTALEEVASYKYLGIDLNNRLNWDSQWERVQTITKSFPFLIRTLKKAGFRDPILINSYRSYALSHFTYSAPVLTSVSERAKNEINSFHNRILRILKMTPEEAVKKYKLLSITDSIDKSCVNLLIKIIKEDEHPLTLKLKINERAISINKKYIAPKANTEAYSNTFLQKYLRLLRDGCTNLYLPRSIKNYNTKYNTNTSQQQLKTNISTTTTSVTQTNTLVACPHCSKLVKSGAGLSAHQRLNKQCNKTVSSEILNSSNITFRRKQ